MAKKENLLKLKMNADEKTIEQIEELKNETKKIGMRIFTHCDQIENLANSTEVVLNDQTQQIETIIENLDEVNEKLKESKSLTKKFSSWFGIFMQNTNTNNCTQKLKTHSHVNSKPPVKTEIEFVSNDPAEEIAEKLFEKLELFESHANNFNRTLKKQNLLINTIEEKVEESEADLKNINKKVKKLI